MTTPPERRKFVRLKVNYLTRHIKFKLPGIDIYPNIDAESKDISEGGLLFTVTHAYQLGDILRIELHIPGWEDYKSEVLKLDHSIKPLPILLMVKVMRVENLGGGKFDIGVSFVGIDEGHREALRKYIDSKK